MPVSAGDDLAALLANVRIDPLEELRELEGIARRQSGKRNVISVESLLCYGADEGAAALGIESWSDVEVDLAHRSLCGVDEADLFGALVFRLCGRRLRPLTTCTRRTRKNRLNSGFLDRGAEI